MKPTTEKLIKTVIAGILTVGGFIWIATQNWQIAVGLFLAMWGNNFTERNNNKDEFATKEFDE